MKSRRTKSCRKKSRSERVARQPAQPLLACVWFFSDPIRLERHEAIHAISLVLSEHMYDLLQAREPETHSIESYYAALERLAVDYWRRSG